MRPSALLNDQDLLSRDSLVASVLVGVVVDNNDPEKLQRIKARCRELHYNYPDEALPWLRPSNTNGPQGNSSGGVGGVALPVVGSRVYVIMDKDDGNFGAWSIAPSALDLKVDELIARDYPHCYGHIDRSGTLTLVNTERDTRLMVHPSGTTFSIDGKGHVKIIVADASVGPNAQQLHDVGLTVEIVGNCHLLTSGDTQIETQGNTHITTNGRTDIHGASDINVRTTTHINEDAPRIDLNTFGVTVLLPDEVTPPKPRKRPEETRFDGQEKY